MNTGFLNRIPDFKRIQIVGRIHLIHPVDNRNTATVIPKDQDIGVCGIDSAEIVFNLGCMLTGFLVLFPGLRMTEMDGRWFRISGYMVIICSVSCAAIGVVTEDYGIMHNITASTYAVFAAIFAITSAAGDYVIGKKVLTALAAVMLIASGIMCVAQPFAVFEPFAISCILIWTFVQSALMLRLDTIKSGSE